MKTIWYSIDGNCKMVNAEHITFMYYKRCFAKSETDHQIHMGLLDCQETRVLYYCGSKEETEYVLRIVMDFMGDPNKSVLVVKESYGSLEGYQAEHPGRTLEVV